jgi:stearoyl-CoA desaturase (delta-9 desaturase)
MARTVSANNLTALSAGQPATIENQISAANGDGAGNAQRNGPAKHCYQVEWLRASPFFAMHFVCLAAIWTGVSWTAFGVAVFLYVVRMFAITGFYHRYFSHKTFKTSRVFQFVLALVGASATQRGALWWAAHHRAHHIHSDDEYDVHSPHRHTFLWSHMLWLTSKENGETNFKAIPDLAKYPELRFLNKHDTLVPIALAVALLGLGWGLNALWPSLGTGPWQMEVWGFFISTVVLFHGTCTINSLSHIFGSKRFPTKDHSKNNWWLALVTLGEGWHNNHHHYPVSVRQGFYWYEYDITYYGLWLLARLGLIWDLKPVPARVYEEAKRLRQ